MKCAGYAQNNSNKLIQAFLFKLKELYDIGKVSKKEMFGRDRELFKYVGQAHFRQMEPAIGLNGAQDQFFSKLHRRQ